METIQINGSGWMYLRIQCIDVRLSKLDSIGDTSYLQLPLYHRSNVKVKHTKFIYCSNWWLLYHPEAIASIISG